MSSLTATASEAAIVKGKPRVRIEYLDGLRGMAALYVMLNHASIMTMELANGHPINRYLAKFLHITHFYLLNYGVYAVDVFIVLSGYCLMLPIARSTDQKMKDTLDFIKRRARRILPPYYAALVIMFLFFTGAHLLHFDTSQMSWHRLAEPVFTPGVILSHLFLVHNWSRAWQSKFDPPMWSVSVEWQIYFFFPFLLLPLYRRWGATVAIVAALVIGLIPHFINSARFDNGHAWFLCLFALGMVGATINFRDRPAESNILQKTPWGVLSIVFAVLVAAITSVQNKSLEHSHALHWLRFTTWGGSWPIDILVGLSTVCLVIYCTHQLSKPTLSKYSIVRIFDSPLMIWVGAFSYSIYLVHSPVLEMVWLVKYHVSPTAAILVFQCVGLPVAVAVSYLFHIAFERPFLSARRKAGKEPVFNLVPPPVPDAEPAHMPGESLSIPSS